MTVSSAVTYRLQAEFSNWPIKFEKYSAFSTAIKGETVASGRFVMDNSIMNLSQALQETVPVAAAINSALECPQLLDMPDTAGGATLNATVKVDVKGDDAPYRGEWVWMFIQTTLGATTKLEKDRYSIIVDVGKLLSSASVIYLGRATSSGWTASAVWLIQGVLNNVAQYSVGFKVTTAYQAQPDFGDNDEALIFGFSYSVLGANLQGTFRVLSEFKELGVFSSDEHREEEGLPFGIPVHEDREGSAAGSDYSLV